MYSKVVNVVNCNRLFRRAFLQRRLADRPANITHNLVTAVTEVVNPVIRAKVVTHFTE